MESDKNYGLGISVLTAMLRFSPPSITNETLSNRWIFDVIAEQWSPWLPNSTDETVRYGGYYTVLVKPGFRIIALNSNVCYTFNWNYRWLLYDDIDPFHQLRWLALTLKEAETKHEFVHILSHVPPGDDTCIEEWTRQFRRIIERYAHIVKGQFNGHTHFDEIRIFYNKTNSDQVINVAYNGGSFTTFNNLNPNYRYYTIDSGNYDVLDYDQWMYDVNEANLEPDKPPRWFKLYSFRDAYGLKSMRNKDMEQFVNNMAQNRSLLNQYHRLKVRDAAPSLLQGCKDSCQSENFCSIVTTEVDDFTQCARLSKKHFSLLPFL